ncbi:Putative carboxylesterase, type B, carboxylesterase type B, active, alpha/Beta hydrolase [Septoria linicola]|uniref:Carboxylic ester hydrolase n=1 Tax=Septoria linicola TaxID=215465 RepID=A0A9Q9ELA1_9PEZI|nr:Putative carboxylesterase, type B, carboxylesterase type B, active, alpha/Beta hydrolase [Septoria linicola]
MDKRIETPRGPILARTDNGLVFGRSIQFATAERWKKPMPSKWSEVRDCTKRGPVCPQNRFRFEFVLGPMPIGERGTSEDCLNLSVITPENASNLPVLIWYHGGANIAGGADLDLMDTSGLARLGLVTVAVQYRLGVYGCVEIPGHAPANLHVYDQMEALRWVQENITSFGGDPSNVTIMGQSAGGWAVYNMLLAPTDGLFHRAIIISAPLGSKAKEGFGDLVKSKLPGDLLKIQADAAQERPGIDNFAPDRRKEPFPADLDKRLAERKDIDLLIGWTADDCLPFLRMIPGVKTAVALPLVGRSVEYWLGQATTTMLFKRGNQQLAQKWTANGGNATTFEFQWFPEGNPFRACHCIEMPFIFGGWASWAAAPLLAGKESEEVVARLAPRVKQMLLKFIKGGLKSGKHIEITADFSEKSYQ